MKFSVNSLKSIREDADALRIAKTDEDYLKLYKNICPISGDVFATMNEDKANPEFVKTAVKEDHMYCDFLEFFTFATAANLNIREAAEELILVNHADAPGVSIDKFHVVFPAQGEVDGEGLNTKGLGLSIDQDTAMKLINGCMHYGLNVNAAPGMLDDGQVKNESGDVGNTNDQGVDHQPATSPASKDMIAKANAAAVNNPNVAK